MPVCKDCSREFFLSEEEMQRFSRKTATGKQLVLPERCAECRASFREERKRLAKLNLQVPQAKSGSGCFRGCSGIEATEASNWPNALDWSGLLSAAANEPNSQIIRFSADYKLLGIAKITTDYDKQEVRVEAIDFSPEIEQYPGSQRGLSLYAISESFRQGFRGRISGDVKQINLSESQRLILKDAGISDEIIAELFELQEERRVDLSWWCAKLAQGRLSGEQFEFLVRTENINMNKLQRLTERPKVIRGRPSSRGMGYMNQLKGLFGNIQNMRFFQELDENAQIQVERKEKTTSVDLIVTPSREIQLKDVLFFSKGKVMPGIMTVKPGSKRLARLAIESKVYVATSYNPARISDLAREVFYGNEIADRSIVMVSRDFRNLSSNPGAAQERIIRAVTEVGGVVMVTDSSVKDIERAVKIFLDELK